METARGTGPYTDGLQAGLILLLRQLAGSDGLAYLLREHQFYPGVFFPVASSWAPPVAEVEANPAAPELHLSNYASLAYVFAGQLPPPGTAVVQSMATDFLTIATSWRLEALFLRRPSFHKSVREHEGRVLFNGDPWVRALHNLASPDDSHYLLMIGGPEAHAGTLTTPRRQILETMLWKSWPIIARRSFIDITDFDQLQNDLVAYFQDEHPSPPDWNLPLFRLAIGGEPRYGLNRLAFNCFLATEVAALREHRIPPTGLDSIEESLKQGESATQGDDLLAFWHRLLARRPHVYKMVACSTSLATYVDYNDSFKASVDQRMAIYKDQASQVFESLLTHCEDHVRRISWPREGERWAFWIRANHLRFTGATHTFGDVDPIIDGRACAFEAFHSLWESSEPGECDLLNAVWAVQLAEASEGLRPVNILPLFMRFNTTSCSLLTERLRTDRPNEPGWTLTKEHAPIQFVVWAETLAGGNAGAREKLGDLARDVLEDAERSKACPTTPIRRLLSHLSRKETFAAGSDLGHNWPREPPLKLKKTIVGLVERHFRLSLEEEAPEVECFYAAIRCFWNATRSKRPACATALMFRLLHRAVEIEHLKAAPAIPFAEWSRSWSAHEVNCRAVSAGEMNGSVPWWVALGEFLSTIWVHNETNERIPADLEVRANGESDLSIEVTLRGFSCATFRQRLEEGKVGDSLKAFTSFLDVIGQEPRLAFEETPEATSRIKMQLLPSGSSDSILRLMLSQH